MTCPRSRRSSPPGPEAGEIEEIAQRLRKEAGLPKKPTGEVANK